MKTLLISLALSLAISAIVSHAADPQLTLPADTVLVTVGDQSQTVPLNALGEADTVRIWDIESVTFQWAADTLVVTKHARYVPLVLRGPNLTRRVTLWFTGARDRLTDMTSILKQHPSFGTSSVDLDCDYRAFWPDDAELAALRETYNLDSVAGDGSDVSRMINLLRWVHSRIRHDGSSPSPHGMDTPELLQIAADTGLSLNCGMYSEVYKDLCLAVGLDARRLVCMPMDKNDNDCHSVNIVWSDSLDRWLFMDPSNRAWFTDSDGAILSPAQIREALVEGDSVAVCDELDRNSQSFDPIQYTGYMAKNLFRFMIWASYHDSSGAEPRKVTYRIHLNPSGYDSDSTGIAAITTANVSEPLPDRRTYYTDNASWFWRH